MQVDFWNCVMGTLLSVAIGALVVIVILAGASVQEDAARGIALAATDGEVAATLVNSEYGAFEFIVKCSDGTAKIVRVDDWKAEVR